jgi:hypothetical protein
MEADISAMQSDLDDAMNDSDFSDLDLELFAERFGVLVVFLFLSEFIGKSVDLGLETVGTFLGGSLGVHCIIQIALGQHLLLKPITYLQFQGYF